MCTFIMHTLHTNNMCQVYSHYELIKPAVSIYIVHEQLRRYQPVVHLLACSEDFPICVVHALFHTSVFFKFKSSCTIVTFRYLDALAVYAWYKPRTCI